MGCEEVQTEVATLCHGPQDHLTVRLSAGSSVSGGDVLGAGRVGVTLKASAVYGDPSVAAPVAAAGGPSLGRDVARRRGWP